MNWLDSLWDQLPQLLVLSPVIGFLVTSVTLQIEPRVVRQLAISNVICTCVILIGLAVNFESEVIAEAAARRPTVEDLAEGGTLESAQAMVHRRVDQQLAAQLDRHLFAIDGINLWPTMVLALLTGFVIWQAAPSVGKSDWFVPTVLLFEGAAIGALTANDLQVYLLSYAAAVLAMGILLGLWGGLERRGIAGRFLAVQFSGGSFVMLGFAILAVAVPWMKIEDSPTPPAITLNISTIIYEIQKWTTANGVAYQYEIETFPWMLSILSLGFAIQCGVFPFQSVQLAIMSAVPRGIVVLYLAGLLSASSVGWLRFVLPLAPDLLVELEWLILFSALGGAIWSSSRSLVPGPPRQQAAFVFSSLFCGSLLGCFAFSRSGLCGSWLMQQQLTAAFCLILLAGNSSVVGEQNGLSISRLRRGGYSTRSRLLMVCLFSLGLFASGFMIVSELFRDLLISLTSAAAEENSLTFAFELFRNSLMIVLAGLTVVFVLAMTYSWLTMPEPNDSGDNLQSPGQLSARAAAVSKRFPGSLVIALAIAVVANLFPNLMLQQCEPAFARVFRRFERTAPASSAEPESEERQTSP